jgi:hypothetical protein
MIHCLPAYYGIKRVKGKTLSIHGLASMVLAEPVFKREKRILSNSRVVASPTSALS